MRNIRTAFRWRVSVLAACAFGASNVAADAACLHTAQLYSCVDASGAATQYYCFGSGAVFTCMNFSGGWLLVAPHELLSQVTTSSMDSQLASALASASPSQLSSGSPTTFSAGTVPNGFVGTSPPQPGVHP